MRRDIKQQLLDETDPATAAEQSPSSQTRVSLPTSSRVGPEGFVWIGSKGIPLLRDATTGEPVQPDAIQPGATYQVNPGANMWVRKRPPDDGTARRRRSPSRRRAA